MPEDDVMHELHNKKTYLSKILETTLYLGRE